MKKILLSITVSLFSFLALAQSVWAIDLSGEWIGAAGEKVKVEQSGNTFSVETDDPKYSGIAGLKGTIAGNTFTGQWYGTAEDCPNLAGYVPARGTISERKIEVKIDSLKYNPQTCVKTRDYEDSYSFTRETVPTMTPQVEKKETSVQNKKESAGDRFKEIAMSIDDIIINPFYQYEFGGYSSEDSRPAYLATLGGKYSFSGDLGAYVEVEFVYLADESKPAEPLFTAPFEDATYTNSTQDPVRLGYNFADSDKEAMMVLYPSATITYHLNRATSLEVSITPAIELDYGEIEVKIDDTEPDRKLVFWTDFLNASAKFTHFWVSHDTNKKQSVVGVYEGEVEVTTKDGKTITVKPDGDKPGVVVVTRKLSPVKLILAGVVLAVAASGIIWFLKKKTAVKSSKKR